MAKTMSQLGKSLCYKIKFDILDSKNITSNFVSTVCVSVSTWQCFCAQSSSIKKWKNLTDLHRALISTPSNTFGMNWTLTVNQTWSPNASSGPHWCSCAWMGPNPCSRFSIWWETFPEEWKLFKQQINDVQQSHMGVMSGCLYIFGHIE